MPGLGLGKQGRVKKVTKLKVGDPGFDPDKTSFAVESTNPRRRVMTLEKVNDRIAQLEKNKADAAASWDTRIAEFTALKKQIEAA